jgi:hypothetical protein
MRVQSITAPLPRPSARSSLIVPKSYWTAYGTAMPTLASRPFQFFDPTGSCQSASCPYQYFCTDGQ